MVGRLGWAGVPSWTEPSWPGGGVGVDLGVGGEGEGGQGASGSLAVVEDGEDAMGG